MASFKCHHVFLLCLASLAVLNIHAQDDFSEVRGFGNAFTRDDHNDDRRDRMDRDRDHSDDGRLSLGIRGLGAGSRPSPSLRALAAAAGRPLPRFEDSGLGSRSGPTNRGDIKLPEISPSLLPTSTGSLPPRTSIGSSRGRTRSRSSSRRQRQRSSTKGVRANPWMNSFFDDDIRDDSSEERDDWNSQSQLGRSGFARMPSFSVPRSSEARGNFGLTNMFRSDDRGDNRDDNFIDLHDDSHDEDDSIYSWLRGSSSRSSNRRRSDTKIPSDSPSSSSSRRSPLASVPSFRNPLSFLVRSDGDDYDGDFDSREDMLDDIFSDDENYSRLSPWLTLGSSNSNRQDGRRRSSARTGTRRGVETESGTRQNRDQTSLSTASNTVDRLGSMTKGANAMRFSDDDDYFSYLPWYSDDSDEGVSIASRANSFNPWIDS